MDLQMHECASGQMYRLTNVLRDAWIVKHSDRYIDRQTNIPAFHIPAQ